MRNAQASADALLLLRNLALAPENKVHFVAKPRALPVLLAAAARAGQNADGGAPAASALWALVHQGEKVCCLDLHIQLVFRFKHNVLVSPDILPHGVRHGRMQLATSQWGSLPSGTPFSIHFWRLLALFLSVATPSPFVHSRIELGDKYGKPLCFRGS